MNQKGFANVVLIILVVVLASALGYLILFKKSAPVGQAPNNNLQNIQPTHLPSTNSQGTAVTPSPANEDIHNPSAWNNQPVITSIVPNPVSVGSVVTINGRNLDVVRENVVQMAPYTILRITNNTTGQSAPILLPQGTATQISFPMPAKVCLDEFVGPPGNCRSSSGYMIINPGKYSVSISVDGRKGKSNTVDLVVQ